MKNRATIFVGVSIENLPPPRFRNVKFSKFDTVVALMKYKIRLHLVKFKCITIVTKSKSLKLHLKNKKGQNKDDIYNNNVTEIKLQ